MFVVENLLWFYRLVSFNAQMNYRKCNTSFWLLQTRTNGSGQDILIIKEKYFWWNSVLGREWNNMVILHVTLRKLRWALGPTIPLSWITNCFATLSLCWDKIGLWICYCRTLKHLWSMHSVLSHHNTWYCAKSYL